MPMVDYTALAFAFLKWVIAILGFLFSIAIVIRLSGVLNLTTCPDCGEKLKRSKRRTNDKTLQLMALGLLPVKRYRCYACYWDGIGFRVFDEGNTIEGQNPD